MIDDSGSVAFQGLNRLENELLVRDFLEVLSTGDFTAIMPFIHRDIPSGGRRTSEPRP